MTKTNMNNVKIFNNFNEYETWSEQFEECEEYFNMATAIVDDSIQKVSCDTIIECKYWKTALRRFEETFAHINPEISGWVAEMRECAENGTFKGSLSECDGKHSWSYGIEQIDENEWYVYLNLRGIYAGFEPQETETTDEEIDAYIEKLEAQLAEEATTEKQDQQTTA